jgi:hypothetical protein
MKRIQTHIQVLDYPGKQPYFEISEMTIHTPMNRARDNWWTLDFASAFLSPGVKSRGELVNSPRTYARNGVGSGINIL